MPTDALSVTGAGAAAAPASLRLASRRLLNLQAARSFGEDRLVFPDLDREFPLPVLADVGDVQFAGKASPLDVFEAIECVSLGLKAAGNIPIFLGGDHSITHPAIAGSGSRPTLFHFDAHLDNDVSTIAKVSDNASVIGMLLEQDLVSNVVSIGTRGFIPRCAFHNSRHRVVTARQAVSASVDQLLSGVEAGDPVWISIDIDALDPAVAPGVRTPLPGGLTLETILRLMCGAIDNCAIAGIDIVELAPDADHNLLTAHSGATIALLAGVAIAGKGR